MNGTKFPRSEYESNIIAFGVEKTNLKRPSDVHCRPSGAFGAIEYGMTDPNLLRPPDQGP